MDLAKGVFCVSGAILLQDGHLARVVLSCSEGRKRCGGTVFARAEVAGGCNS